MCTGRDFKPGLTKFFGGSPREVLKIDEKAAAKKAAAKARSDALKPIPPAESGGAQASQIKRNAARANAKNKSIAGTILTQANAPEAELRTKTLLGG